VFYERALATAREADDRRAAGLALASLGLLCCRRGEYQEAAPLLEESIRTHEGLGGITDSIRGRRRSMLGLAYWRLGDTARGMALLEEGLALTRAAGDWTRAEPGAGCGVRAPGRRGGRGEGRACQALIETPAPHLEAAMRRGRVRPRPAPALHLREKGAEENVCRERNFWRG